MGGNEKEKDINQVTTTIKRGGPKAVKLSELAEKITVRDHFCRRLEVDNNLKRHHFTMNFMLIANKLI